MKRSRLLIIICKQITVICVVNCLDYLWSGTNMHLTKISCEVVFINVYHSNIARVNTYI